MKTVREHKIALTVQSGEDETVWSLGEKRICIALIHNNEWFVAEHMIGEILGPYPKEDCVERARSVAYWWYGEFTGDYMSANYISFQEQLPEEGRRVWVGWPGDEQQYLMVYHGKKREDYGPILTPADGSTILGNFNTAFWRYE